MLERNKNNHFANYPVLDIARTKFPMNNRYKTTFSSSVLVPVYVQEILAGDTVEMNMHQATRMATPIFPVMDTAMQDVFWFFTPNRILWDKYKAFFGENETPEEWENPTEYEIPQIKAPAEGWKEGTLADYFGLPINVPNKSVTHLPFRAYCMIWNEYFKNVSTKTSVYINKDETTLEGKNTIEDPVTDAQLGGGLLKVARFHDMFTSALPQVSRGGDVLLPIGNEDGLIPVHTSQNAIPEIINSNVGMTLEFKNRSSTAMSGAYGITANIEGSIAAGTSGKAYVKTSSANENYKGDVDVYPRNLWANVSSLSGAAITMNMFYQAYAIQNLLWRDGVNGTRYRSLIKSHFRTTISDSTAQVPEYLGGTRYSLNMDQVTQTSATNEVSPQGNVAGMSLTSTSDHMFTKSFEEPGILMGLMCVRNVESYQQGIPRYWTKKSRFDFYWPELANIGEMAVLNQEIYAQGNYEDEEVFGYNEAWYDYRTKESIVTGKFRSNAEGTLDSWHYANFFDSLPTLAGLIDATDENIERTIAVQNEPQFITDIYFQANYIRPIPMHSIPGLRTYM